MDSPPQALPPVYWPQPPVRPPPPRPTSRLRSDGWVIAVGVLASLGVLLTAALWLYLGWRIFRSRSRLRTVWPGQLLLAVILSSYALLYAFLPRPSPASCGILRFGIGVAYALCFSTLLLKLLIIVARNKGVFLPVSVEVLLLVLTVGVQVAVNAHWLIVISSAEVFVQASDGTTSCNISIFSWLHSLAYIMLLMIAGVGTSVHARKLKDNHREPVFIGLVFGFSLPIWIVWTTTAIILRAHPAVLEQCLAFGLLANMTLILFAMFIPKVRQLSAIGAAGLYREDYPLPKTMTEMSVQKIYYPVYPENGSRPSQLDVGRYMRHLYGLSVPSTVATPSPALPLPRFYPRPEPIPGTSGTRPRLTPMPADDVSTTASYQESMADIPLDNEDSASEDGKAADYTRRRPSRDIPTYARVHKNLIY